MLRRRIALGIVVLTLSSLSAVARGQEPPRATSAPSAPSTLADKSWRVTLTIFRSPGTGIQLSKGAFAAFVAHYPTILRRDGRDQTTQFIRVGVAAYGRPDGRTSPYVSLSIAPSLTSGWTTSGLVDVGVRQRFTSRLSGQLGVAALHAWTLKTTRVNPTVGLGVHF